MVAREKTRAEELKAKKQHYLQHLLVGYSVLGVVEEATLLEKMLGVEI